MIRKVTEVIRGSNRCLKFLTFQPSNYWGFEIVKYTLVYSMWHQLALCYHSILPDTTVWYSTDSITIIVKFTRQTSEKIQIRYALKQNKLDIQLKLGTCSLNQNSQRACPRLYLACSCNWLTLHIWQLAIIEFCLIYYWQGSNLYTSIPWTVSSSISCPKYFKITVISNQLFKPLYHNSI